MSHEPANGGALVRSQVDGPGRGKIARFRCVWCDFQLVLPEAKAENIEWCPKGCEHEAANGGGDGA